MPLDKEYIIRLNAFDLGEWLDGLETRAHDWRNTATYLITGEAPTEDYIAEEARKLAEHYERIIALVMEQQTHHDRP